MTLYQCLKCAQIVAAYTHETPGDVARRVGLPREPSCEYDHEWRRIVTFPTAERVLEGEP